VLAAVPVPRVTTYPPREVKIDAQGAVHYGTENT
jgi:hypothetical protein